MYQEVERLLKAWIDEKRAEGACLDGVAITGRAFVIAAELNISTFNGSRGWLNRFLKRSQLVLR